MGCPGSSHPPTSPEQTSYQIILHTSPLGHAFASPRPPLLLARFISGSPILDLTQATQPRTPNTTWTIIEHRIACTPTQCLYTFDITEATPNQPQQGPTHCEFTVDTAPGTAAALPANRTSFQDKTCGSIYKNSYTVNGGFMNASGAVVLCFKNPPEGNWAFFGFDPWEFLSGPQKTSPALPIGTYDNITAFSYRNDDV
ncbi:uncharacterized protein PG986_004384 [Apiospora aurea]|uniref:Ubiquitin 3 binding protein But2 C-terminal domain-containing protein n=1 Tax=Apiospora aurea TaxID=335848 RepID=A0ABR1QN67_9PEZI